ncbi:predicted protein [Nematostella vectensis]|uniref:Protein HGH1 homolog n=1 Tax=Nematostella vectensis TaxID=45351 RepID=A7S8Q6_NEMVE|nr:protein HGH1 homolog isoform X1 [Nematostella vectensis]EDO39914.1 predicted protein [Nematostella vectensis]|eukprot:XP_001631977.1 predicted protein [Nematostella vectensis]
MATSIEEKQATELLGFLKQSERGDVRYFALDYILGLTVTESGQQFLKNNEEFLSQLYKLTRDSNEKISSDAYSALINLSAVPALAEKLLKFKIIIPLVDYLLNENSIHADKCAVVLSNLTRTESTCEIALNELLAASPDYVYRVVERFCESSLVSDSSPDSLALFISNLTQMKKGRELMLDRKRCVIQRLLPFTQHKSSLNRRGGVVTILKNCCFETDTHDWLLNDEVDILPHLLLPLAGGEELTEEETDKLPPDLQYLDESKERETDPDIRNMLLESLLQLLATKNGRTIMRDKNVYVILRELHNWEKDEIAQATCLKCIHILIGEEPEPGMENLREVVIPDNIKFD